MDYKADHGVAVIFRGKTVARPSMMYFPRAEDDLAAHHLAFLLVS